MEDSGRYTMVFPDYTIGREAYEKIREVCPRYGKSVVVIGGRTAIAKAEEKIISAVEGVGLEFTGFILFGGEASYENVMELSHDPAVHDADMIFAVGGGKAIDTAKVLAHTVNKPFFTFPTVASSCAAFASIGSMYDAEGHFQELAFSDIPPIHVFLCSRIAIEAPVEYLIAGIGDTLAKYYEANISSRGAKLAHSDAMGIALSRMCAEPIFEYGAQAIEDNKKGIISEAFEEVMLAIVVSSGMVSNFAAYDYNGHMAHTLFTELAELPQAKRCHMHGELVIYGVLLLLICDKQEQEFERVYDFCKKVGLPTGIEHIEATQDEIDRVFCTTEKNQDTEHAPYKITKVMLKAAAEKLEAYNKEHK